MLILLRRIALYIFSFQPSHDIKVFIAFFVCSLSILQVSIITLPPFGINSEPQCDHFHSLKWLTFFDCALLINIYWFYWFCFYIFRVYSVQQLVRSDWLTIKMDIWILDIYKSIQIYIYQIYFVVISKRCLSVINSSHNLDFIGRT